MSTDKQLLENKAVTWLDLAIPLVARFEGFEKKRKDGLLHPYLDRLAKPHVWTRGAGRTYSISENSSPITVEEAKKELGEGLQVYAAKCLILCPILATRPYCFA